MRLRKILVVHSSRAVSQTVMSFVLSELGDIEFMKAESGHEALSYLQTIQFQIVIADNDLVDMSFSAFYDKMKALKPNQETPIIVLVPKETLTPEYIDQICQAGIEHCLGVPFPAKAIVDKINQVCNPRLWRENDRFHIPNAKVFLQSDDMDIDIDLINISMGGILCDFFYDRQPIELLGMNHIKIHIPAPEGFFEIRDLKCKLSRLNVIDWASDGMVAHLRMTLLFTDLSDKNMGLVEQLIEMAREKNLHDRRKIEDFS